jgi:hypothetical protein
MINDFYYHHPVRLVQVRRFHCQFSCALGLSLRAAPWWEEEVREGLRAPCVLVKSLSLPLCMYVCVCVCVYVRVHVYTPSFLLSSKQANYLVHSKDFVSGSMKGR